jgi:hypothetical protein
MAERIDWFTDMMNCGTVVGIMYCTMKFRVATNQPLLPRVDLLVG